MVDKKLYYTEEVNRAGHPLPRRELREFIVNVLEESVEEWAGADDEYYYLNMGDYVEHKTFGGGSVIRVTQYTRIRFRPDHQAEYSLIRDGWRSDSEAYVEPDGEKFFRCVHSFVPIRGYKDQCEKCGLIDDWGQTRGDYVTEVPQ